MALDAVPTEAVRRGYKVNIGGIAVLFVTFRAAFCEFGVIDTGDFDGIIRHLGFRRVARRSQEQQKCPKNPKPIESFHGTIHSRRPVIRRTP